MDDLMCYLFAVILAVAGFVYVGHINSQDSELIERCKHDPQCVNPWSGERFGQ